MGVKKGVTSWEFSSTCREYSPRASTAQRHKTPLLHTCMKPLLSFQFFTQAAKSRQLWRLIVRTANKSPQNRDELLGWARAEFNQHKNETDPTKIRFLVGDGLKRTREMAEMLGHAVR